MSRKIRMIVAAFVSAAALITGAAAVAAPAAAPAADGVHCC